MAYFVSENGTEMLLKVPKTFLHNHVQDTAAHFILVRINVAAR